MRVTKVLLPDVAQKPGWTRKETDELMVFAGVGRARIQVNYLGRLSYPEEYLQNT